MLDVEERKNSRIPPAGIILLSVLYLCFAGNAFYFQNLLPVLSPWIDYLGFYWLVSAALFFVRFSAVWVLLRGLAYLHAWLWAFSILMSLGIVLSSASVPVSSALALAFIYISQIFTILVLIGARGYLNEQQGRKYFGVDALSERAAG